MQARSSSHDTRTNERLSTRSRSGGNICRKAESRAGMRAIAAKENLISKKAGTSKAES